MYLYFLYHITLIDMIGSKNQIDSFLAIFWVQTLVIYTREILIITATWMFLLQLIPKVRQIMWGQPLNIGKLLTAISSHKQVLRQWLCGGEFCFCKKIRLWSKLAFLKKARIVCSWQDNLFGQSSKMILFVSTNALEMFVVSVIQSTGTLDSVGWHDLVEQGKFGKSDGRKDIGRFHIRQPHICDSLSFSLHRCHL